MSYISTGCSGLEPRDSFIQLLRAGRIYLDMHAGSDCVAMRGSRGEMYGSNGVYVFDENGILKPSPVARLGCVALRRTSVAVNDCRLEFHPRCCFCSGCSTLQLIDSDSAVKDGGWNFADHVVRSRSKLSTRCNNSTSTCRYLGTEHCWYLKTWSRKPASATQRFPAMLVTDHVSHRSFRAYPVQGPGAPCARIICLCPSLSSESERVCGVLTF